MSYLVLARKYRPRSFEEVVAQRHVTRTLSNAISAGRVAHAILFSGPRGTGKTTVARILAKAMNCAGGPTAHPCNTCHSCTEITAGSAVDVFEIDGASNNSVDQVRELRDNVRYMPAHSRFKIYIIDEVHMLSIAAFNALLKTLEEPPAHVMFLFATTEPQKIPITILSRCQRYDFRRIGQKGLVEQMQHLCQAESFRISEKSLWRIAGEAGGSMRDALSLLDQVMACSGEAAADDLVLDILGVVDREVLSDMAAAVLAGDLAAVLKCIDDIYGRGHEMLRLYTELVTHFRNLMVVKMGAGLERLVDMPAEEIEKISRQVEAVPLSAISHAFEYLLQAEASVKLALQPKLALEMVFMRLVNTAPTLPIDVLIEKLDRLGRQIGMLPATADNRNAPALPTGQSESDGETPSAVTAADSAEAMAEPLPDSRAGAGPAYRGNDAAACWPRVVGEVAAKSPALAASLAGSCVHVLSGERLQLDVQGNGFQLNMVKREKHLRLLEDTLRRVLGKPVKIVVCGAGEGKRRSSESPAALREQALRHPLVQDTLDIFKGRIVDVKILSKENK